MKAVFILRLSLCFLLFSNLLFAKPTEIVLWHAMAGSLDTEVNRIAQAFNQSQSDYIVKPIYKGSYLETLTAFSAAFHAHVPPAIVQIFEVGTSTMSRSPELTISVTALMKKQHLSWHEDDLWPALKHYYSNKQGLMALPFNVSIPIMYYNQERLQRLGYTEKTFPKTWQAFEILLKQLREKGDACGYTTAYPAWIHIESFDALHGLSENKNDLAVFKQAHLKRLLRWQKAHWFEYAGRIDEATILFTSGKCALFSQSSGAYQSLKATAPFEVGIAPIPIDRKQLNRHSNVVGGGALWVVAGQPQKTQQGIAKFFQFLMRPDIQQQWYVHTGYLPILKTLKINDNIIKLAQKEWSEMKANHGKRGAEHRTRMLSDEVLEAMFAGLLTPEQALNQLVLETDYALLRFERNHRKGR